MQRMGYFIIIVKNMREVFVWQNRAGMNSIGLWEGGVKRNEVKLEGVKVGWFLEMHLNCDNIQGFPIICDVITISDSSSQIFC